MTMELTLPPHKHYHYFSDLFRTKELIPYEQWCKIDYAGTWEYPELDKQRFERLLLKNVDYIADSKVLDLGCHIGYSSYIAKWLGARSVHGINSRDLPLEIANYAFQQLQQSNFTFTQGDIEDLSFLKTACEHADTVILGLVLEHLRNPYAVIDTISKSNVGKILIESTVYSDEGEPGLKYYMQSTESPFTVWDANAPQAIGSVPNVAWLESILYYMGWKIEMHQVDRCFNSNWFSMPNARKFPPFTYKSLTIVGRKFKETDIEYTFED